jgi:spore maturation protein CgeB
VKIVIFGLTISSAWGNGHATLWRGLCRALARRGHDITFFERDVPYYAAHRDTVAPAGCRLRLYTAWVDVRREAETTATDSDVAIVTSYCPDGAAASDLVVASRASLRVFYDLDTPVTLQRLAQREPVPYLPARGLRDFDLVLSYTGGRALEELRTQLGARHVAPLYGSVDPQAHRRVEHPDMPPANLSYLGTYAPDRQQMLEQLFIEPARRCPSRRFMLGGSQYPDDFPWGANVYYMSHMPPPMHPAFYSASALTLNVTRGPMAGMGYCPSGRLFEAAACGTPILSDTWEGIGDFFEPGEEILVAHDADDAVAALELPEATLSRIAHAARERTLAEHTAECRALEFEQIAASVT